MRSLTQLAEKYRQMPNGGAVLRVLSDGAISNGMAIEAKFEQVVHAPLF